MSSTAGQSCGAFSCFWLVPMKQLETSLWTFAEGKRNQSHSYFINFTPYIPSPFRIGIDKALHRKVVLNARAPPAPPGYYIRTGIDEAFHHRVVYTVSSPSASPLSPYYYMPLDPTKLYQNSSLADYQAPYILKLPL